MLNAWDNIHVRFGVVISFVQHHLFGAHLNYDSVSLFVRMNIEYENWLQDMPYEI